MEIKGLTGQDVRLGGMASLMDKKFGFSTDEYNAIKGVTVEKLLKEIPSKEKAWEIWRDIDKSIDLPHDGIYGSSEFSKHIKLAEFIRDFESREGIEQMTIAEALGKMQGSTEAAEATGGEVTNIELDKAFTKTPSIAPGAEEAGEEVTNIELGDKTPDAGEAIIEPLTGRDKEITNLLLTKNGAEATIEQLKTGKIKSDEFANLYTRSLNLSKEESLKIHQTIKTNIENLNKPRARMMASKSLRVMFNQILTK